MRILATMMWLVAAITPGMACGGEDVAGAKWFGYPTFWNNRQGAPAEGLDVEPDGAGATLADLVKFLAAT